MTRAGKPFERAEGSMSKLVAGETAVRVTEQAIQILGVKKPQSCQVRSMSNTRPLPDAGGRLTTAPPGSVQSRAEDLLIPGEVI
jgi:hypothetical protein